MHRISYKDIKIDSGVEVKSNKIENALTLQINNGTIENTNKYTFDGSSAKTLDIIPGTNVTLTTTANTLTIDSTNTTYTAGTGLTLTGNEFSLSASGATAGNYGTNSTTTLTSGGTFIVPKYTIDTQGRIINSENVTMTLPSSSGSSGTGTTTLPAAMTNSYSHNSFYIENDISTLFDNGTFSTQIANGTFDDIYPGCYFTKSVTIAGTAYTCTFKVVDIDPFYGGFDSEYIEPVTVNTHHVGVVITNGLPNHVMNSTNTTDGGYVGSEMYTWLTGDVLTGLTTTLTSAHMLAHSKEYSNIVDNSLYNKSGTATGATSHCMFFSNQYISLLSETQVYGSTIWSSSGYDTGEALKQLSAFKLVYIWKVFRSSGDIWLRDVGDSNGFCTCNGLGTAGISISSYDSGHTCPLILLK